MTSIKGIVFSCFDLLHAGHITMLEECKEKCNYLIAGLHINPAHKEDTVQSVYERYVQLKGCKYVDEIICYETEQDLLNLLNMVKWHVRIIGEEYKGKAFTHFGLTAPSVQAVFDFQEKLRNAEVEIIKEAYERWDGASFYFLDPNGHTLEYIYFDPTAESPS